MLWINAGMAYHLRCAWSIQRRSVVLQYYAAVFATLLCYIRSGQWKQRGRDDKCAYWHMASGGTANRRMYYALAASRRAAACHHAW